MKPGGEGVESREKGGVSFAQNWSRKSNFYIKGGVGGDPKPHFEREGCGKNEMEDGLYPVDFTCRRKSMAESG